MRKLFILFCSLVALQVQAQEKPQRIKVGILSGVDFFKQPGLTARNQYVIGAMPFDVRTIDDFKPRFNFGAYTQYMITSRLSVGPEYAYHFNGSRIGARDYSGFFALDQYLRTYRLGLKIDYTLFSIKRSTINIGADAGAGFTKWKVVSDLEIGEEIIEMYSARFKGHSWFSAPLVQYQYRLFSKFNMSCAASYCFEFFVKYRTADNYTFKNQVPSFKGFNVLFGFEYGF